VSATQDAPARAAAGSSFYAGMRILPREKREAMYAVYDFCREVDDVADGDWQKVNRDGDPQAEIEAWRADIEGLYRGAPGPRAAPLAPHVARFSLAREDFLAVIDGMEMDLRGPIVAPDRTTLDLYCDRVASAVGRLSTPIFGMAHEPGRALAHHLGRALQMTNILRDLDEDAGAGRLYLPREALLQAGITDFTPATVIAHPALGTACADVLMRAKNHFARAHEIMDQSPRRVVKAPRLMASAYAHVLTRIERRGFAPPRERIGVDKMRLLGAVLRYALP
jgi:squalene synthase HpnD